MAKRGIRYRGIRYKGWENKKIEIEVNDPEVEYVSGKD